MATSKTSADVLALGKHIVAELQLNDRGDWLRHWLAHHIAELIREAQDSKDSKLRREAAKNATEAILKIWEHRADVPGGVNPLARYREALRALLELRPNPRRRRFLDDFSGPGVVGSIYRRFPRLIDAMVLLPSVQAGKHDRATSKAVRKFLNKDEETLLEMLEIRIKTLDEDEDRKTVAKPMDDYLRFEVAANKLIDNTIADLRSVREGNASGPSARRPRKLAR